LKTLLMKALPLALLLAVAFLLAACGAAGSGQQGDQSGGHGQMDHGSMGMGSKGMVKQMVMENGKYSDEAFIDAMVPHHQGAIAMAEVALKNAEHEEIKELSRNIVSTQQSEIEELKSIKKDEFGTSNVSMEMSPGQMRGMGMMMDANRLSKWEPFDKAFIDAMIPHHQSAIYMSQVSREESKIPAIKQLAEDIIDAQKREIEQMKQWRRQWHS
jgi:uncharacterized protein (DUF305 family)